MAEAKKVSKAKTTKKATPEAKLIVEATPEKVNVEPENVAAQEPKATAKAGRRSAKAVKAAEEKSIKQARKAEAGPAAVDDKKIKPAAKPTRPRLERRGKKFRQAAEQIDKTKVYSLAEATGLIANLNPAKFDATVELHVRLKVDPKQADQNVRGTLSLPAGSGKNLRVAVFADETVKQADLSGLETITKLLDKQQLDFDVLIATPATMAKLGQYARLLGPRGLMPNPKSGTVTSDLQAAVKQAKAGRLEYRVDSTGIVHAGIGKCSFTPAQLLDNLTAVVAHIKDNKPASVKSGYIKSAYVSTTMGPSLPVAL
ncbi:MAG: 50S ribosomal protein L1 [Candidatus Saccharimonadales bacterium]